MGATSNPLGQVRPDLHVDKWAGGDGVGAPRQLHRSSAWRPGLAKTMQPPSFPHVGLGAVSDSASRPRHPRTIVAGDWPGSHNSALRNSALWEVK